MINAFLSLTAVVISFACSETTMYPISSFRNLILLNVLTKKLFFSSFVKVNISSLYLFMIISLISSFCSSSSLSSISGVIVLLPKFSSKIISDPVNTL